MDNIKGTYRLLVTLDPYTRGMLLAEAKEEGVSMAEVVRKAVRTYVSTAEAVRNPRAVVTLEVSKKREA